MNREELLAALDEFALRVRPFEDARVAADKYDQARTTIAALYAERDALREAAMAFDLAPHQSFYAPAEGDTLRCVFCGELSYLPHREACWVAKLTQALAPRP